MGPENSPILVQTQPIAQTLAVQTISPPSIAIGYAHVYPRTCICARTHPHTHARSDTCVSAHAHAQACVHMGMPTQAAPTCTWKGYPCHDDGQTLPAAVRTIQRSRQSSCRPLTTRLPTILRVRTPRLTSCSPCWKSNQRARATPMPSGSHAGEGAWHVQTGAFVASLSLPM